MYIMYIEVDSSAMTVNCNLIDSYEWYANLGSVLIHFTLTLCTRRAHLCAL